MNEQIAAALHAAKGTHNINRWQRMICNKPGSDAHMAEARFLLAALAANGLAVVEQPAPAGDHVHDWQCVICGEQHPTQAATPPAPASDELRAAVERLITARRQDVRPGAEFWLALDALERVLAATADTEKGAEK